MTTPTKVFIEAAEETPYKDPAHLLLYQHQLE